MPLYSDLIFNFFFIESFYSLIIFIYIIIFMNNNNNNFIYEDISTIKGVGSKLKKYLKKKLIK